MRVIVSISGKITMTKDELRELKAHDPAEVAVVLMQVGEDLTASIEILQPKFKKPKSETLESENVTEGK